MPRGRIFWKQDLGHFPATVVGDLPLTIRTHDNIFKMQEVCFPGRRRGVKHCLGSLNVSPFDRSRLSRQASRVSFGPGPVGGGRTRQPEPRSWGASRPRDSRSLETPERCQAWQSVWGRSFPAASLLRPPSSRSAGIISNGQGGWEGGHPGRDGRASAKGTQTAQLQLQVSGPCQAIVLNLFLLENSESSDLSQTRQLEPPGRT